MTPREVPCNPASSEPPRSRARDTARDVQAIAVRLATRNNDICPGPVGASAASARNHNVVSIALNAIIARDVLQHQIGDGDARGRCAAIEVAAVVVLLNENSVAGNVRERNVLVRHARDGACVTLDCLDADS